jgi:hypothetical protein
LTRDGVLEMNRLYAAQASEVHPELQAALKQAQELLEAPTDELDGRRERLRHYTGALIALREALQSQNPSAVREAYDNLRALHSGERVAVDELNPEALLQFSLQHPPVAIVADGWAPKLPFLLGSIVTTWAYTSLGVDSYHGVTWAKVAQYSMLSAALYGLAYYGQTALNALIDRWKASKQPERPALPASTQADTPITPPVVTICEAQLLPEGERNQ